LYSTSTRSVSKALRYSTHCCRGIIQFYLYTLRFIHNDNELYLPLPYQLKLVLIYRPRRDGRLSKPRCKVSRDSNLQPPNCKPALYHTATSNGCNRVSEQVGFNILINSLSVISETSLSGQSLALVLTTKQEQSRERTHK